MRNIWFTGWLKEFGSTHPLFSYILNNPPEGYKFQDHQDGCLLAFVPNWIIPIDIPWVLEIEDVVELFYPQNQHGVGVPADFEAIRATVQTSLEHPLCRAIVTHIRSTAECLPRLFGDKVGQKVHYIRPGIVTQPPPARLRRRGTTLLFTNSWHQLSDGFYVRGGMDVLEVFRQLVGRGKDFRLIVKSIIPYLAQKQFGELLQHPRLIVLDHFLSAPDLQSVFEVADIFLLPSARVHSICLLEAMAAGAVCLASDGWANSEIIEHNVTGLIINGRYGKTSWVDSTGLLREDYSPMMRPDKTVSLAFASAVEHLIDNPSELLRLREAAYDKVQTDYSVDNWRTGLKQLFEECYG